MQAAVLPVRLVAHPDTINLPGMGFGCLALT